MIVANKDTINHSIHQFELLYFRWWLRPGARRRHSDFQSDALLTELPSHPIKRKALEMAGQTRLELAIFAVTERHVNHYTTSPLYSAFLLSMKDKLIASKKYNFFRK